MLGLLIMFDAIAKKAPALSTKCLSIFTFSRLFGINIKRSWILAAVEMLASHGLTFSNLIKHQSCLTCVRVCIVLM